MPNFNQIQNTFLGGEVSPRIYGRTDLPQYLNAAKELKNIIVYPQGGASRRPGTEFVSITGTSEDGKKARLVPFIFSEDEAYMVEITDDNFRIYNTDTLVETDVTTFVDTTDHQQGSFYSESEMDSIQFAQKADLLYLVHPDKMPLIVVRTGANTFEIRAFYLNGGTLDETNLWLSHPFRDVNTDTTLTITPSGTTGSVTLTASSSLFDSGHVGALFRLDHVGTEGAAVITAFSSDTSVTALVLSNFSSTAATSSWRESAWSDFRGWPRSVTFFESRIYYGGNASEPDTIWASQLFNIRQMMSPPFEQDADPDPDTVSGQQTLAERPFNFAIASNRVNEIQWLSSGKSLTVGTRGEEYLARGSDPNAAFSATNVGFQAETAHGSAHVQPFRIGNAVIFLQRAFQKLREFVFNFNEDAFRAPDLSILAENLPRKTVAERTSPVSPKILGMAQQESPNSILWAYDSNGGLIAMTREREQGIIAWHTHVIGGTLSGEIPKVVSVAVAPSGDGTNDDVWVCVQRTIESETRYYTERIGKEFELEELFNSSTSLQDKPVYSDSAKLVRLTSPGKTFTGFEHLHGQTVDVLADGSSIGQKTVQAGTELISNQDAEVDVAGHVAYADAAAATPVDGTGGSPTVTITRNTVGEINGIADFLITKDAADRQGEGVGIDFTVDTANLGKKHRISFSYDASDANYSTGDLRVYIIGDTGGTPSLITPNSVNLVSGAGTQTFTADFTAHATGAAHRVAIHVATVNALAYAVQYDDITVKALGEIVLDRDHTEVLAGLNYRTRIETLPIEAGAAIGSAQGAIKRIDRAVVRFSRTVGAKIGPSDTELETLLFRPTTVPMDEETPLFTGDKEVKFDGTVDRDARVVVIQDLPLPMNVTAIIQRGQTYD